MRKENNMTTLTKQQEITARLNAYCVDYGLELTDYTLDGVINECNELDFTASETVHYIIDNILYVTVYENRKNAH